MTRKDKRKNRKKARKEKKSVGHVETGEDRFGVDDHISRLPDLCLLKICTHLTRHDIYHLSLVNSRLLPIADERSLDHIKWTEGHLEIYQTKKGYYFSLTYKNDYPDRNKHEKDELQYEIIERGNSFIERRYRDYYDEPTRDPHSWPIPEQFFDCLHELLRHIDVESLTTHGLPMDSLCYTKLERMLDSHTLKRFTAFNMNYQQMTHEGRMSLARFIKKVPEVELFCSGSLVNEDFLREVGGSKVRELSMEPDREDDHHQKLANVFRPADTILPYLTSFKILEVPTMELKATWIAKFCMLFIDANPSLELCWIQFSLDRPLTENMIAAYIRRNEYKYEWNENGEYHYITRIADDCEARIQQDVYQVEGRNVQRIYLRFSNKDNREDD